MIHLISLGAGVQSSTMALMAACGEITPMPTAAIFADTQVEPDNVYRWLEWLTVQLPYPTHQVTAGNLAEESLKLRVSKKTGQTYSKTLIPAFVAKPTGGTSLLGRKCTADFKVQQIIRQCRRIVGKDALLEWRRKHKMNIKAVAKAAKSDCCAFDEWAAMQSDPLVTAWIGISLDETQRMKESREPWIKNTWPLVTKRMTREDCLSWMSSHSYPEPPRSACVFCPFHSDNEWARLRDNEPSEFAKAVMFERSLQASLAQSTGTAKLHGIAYLHDSLIPLDQVDFKVIDTSIKQLSLFSQECEGMCGI